MFSCVGVLYDRMHSRMIRDYGGVANVMPWFAAFMIFFAMANSGLPGTSGFVGEFMVILASFQQHPLLGVRRGDHADHRRRLHAVAGQARDLGRRRPMRMSPNSRTSIAREWIVLGVFAAGVLLIGVVAQAADRPDGTVHRATGEPARRDQAVRKP